PETTQGFGVRRYWHWPGNGGTHYPAPWWTHLGGRGSGAGRDVLFHTAPGDRPMSGVAMAVQEALSALIIEDSEEDAELIILELKRGGYKLRCRVVDTAEALASALE